MLTLSRHENIVIPAKAGIQEACKNHWTPAFAGVTGGNKWHRIQVLRWLAFICLFLPCQQLAALSTDREQPMHLEADHAKIDEKSGVHIYTGNVVITQGTLRITADHLTVNLVEGDIDQAVALGKPATYKQRPDGKDQDVEAESLRMEYYANDGKLILIDSATVWQGQDTFASERINYDIDRDIVNAGTGEDRVRITLQPKKKSDDAQ